ncbi:MAG: hypothetical protein ACJAVR_001893 [Paracoccaceae bacterium]|jgi:hypothetical protein
MPSHRGAAPVARLAGNLAHTVARKYGRRKTMTRKVAPKLRGT